MRKYRANEHCAIYTIHQSIDIHIHYSLLAVMTHPNEWSMCHEIILKINIQYAQVQQTRAAFKAHGTTHSTYEYDSPQISEKKAATQFFRQWLAPFNAGIVHSHVQFMCVRSVHKTLHSKIEKNENKNKLNANIVDAYGYRMRHPHPHLNLINHHFSFEIRSFRAGSFGCCNFSA